MTSNGRRAKWTVEKLAADYDYIDVLWFYRRGLLANNWVSLVPMLRCPRVSKIRASRYLALAEWHDRPDPQQIRVSWRKCHLGKIYSAFLVSRPKCFGYIVFCETAH
jgi:hypothetical protein